MPGWPDAEIAELAARQQTIISHAQLRHLDVSASAIDRARRRGRLHRVHRGVYSLVLAAARPMLAAEHAALLVCGQDSVLSHDSAAFLLKLGDRPPSVHVTIGSGHHRSRPGLVVHRTRRLSRDETTKVGRLWTTSIPRTVHDLSHALQQRPFERLVDEALKRVSARRLTHIPRAREIVTGDHRSTLTWSEAEERLRALIAKAELPQPESNVPLGRFIPDLLWREQRLIVEYDGYRDHSGPAKFHSDRERRNHFEALGYRILHVTSELIRDRPERLLVQVATILARHP